MLQLLTVTQVVGWFASVVALASWRSLLDVGSLYVVFLNMSIQCMQYNADIAQVPLT